jgi:serine/threonine-protein kinase
MGEVWLAEHRMLVRPAAIKLIRPDTLGSDAAASGTLIQRFEREARSTAALDSRHTIEIFDFGITQDGAFYYVMELLDGLSLEELVRKFGPVPASRATYLLKQVCHSLNEAHERGMIHRDIKPANIFTCRKGPDHDYVKVLDFGLVKPTAPAHSAELTADGVATGTPAFMSPEVALGKDYVDARVDIYGLGCVAYWLLSGGLVFERESPLAMVVAHVQEEPEAPSSRSELEISPRLDEIVLRCLAKNPADRPQTAAAVGEMLAGASDGAAWDGELAAEWWRLHLPDRLNVERLASSDESSTYLVAR